MQYDVIIIGAGPAGLCLAKALCDLNLNVALVERQSRTSLAEPQFDGREIALTHGSMRLLRDLGIWQRLPEGATSPLRAARVIEGSSTNEMRIDANLAGKPELGMLVANHHIREAAWGAVHELASLTLFDSAHIESLHTTDDHACVTLGDGQRLTASLLIAADSRFSETRRAMGIGAEHYDFGKSMLVCRVQHEQAHKGVAWEWFGQGQTLALLPLQEHLASVVVTLPDRETKRLAALDEDAFAREIEHRYAHRLGAMQLQSSRHVYPLVGVYARRFIGRRFALVGDAAVGMHPVTAHGFNLGLASVERLASTLRKSQSNGQDLGAAEALASYERRHRRGSRPLYLATRAIVELYTNDRAPARVVRDAVLRAGRRFTPFKRVLAHTLADERPLDRSGPRDLIQGLRRSLRA